MPSSNRAAPAYVHPVPQEEYDPYRFSRDQNEQQQQQDDEDFYREIRLDAYENQVDDNVPLSGGGQEQTVYRAREEYEEEYFGANINNEPNEDRSSNAPSAYRPREEVYDGDEEKLQLAQDDSFDAEDWDEKEKELDFNSPFEEFAGGFGAPPERAMTRRTKTARKVKLTAGNLVLDCAIPTRLSTFLPRAEEEEYQTTRYTAVTCGPEDFNESKYVLRPTLYNRETELMVVVTLYNENEVLFCRTLHGIMKNIAHLCTRNKSKTWGKDGWKKIVVCIVADGRKAVHPRVFDCLAALGVYQEGMAKNRIGDKPCQAHIYEYTTQLSIDPDLKFKGLEKGIVPTQIIFCLKEENAKKLNSHRWALQAFAPQLDPTVVILIDVGTKPGPKSLYYLWKTFDLNSSVGGACGEIVTMKGKGWMGLLNPLVAVQNFEYKMSNILDKPTESVFGYITVLPGAFSAYRYIALKNDALGHGPLASYFKGEHLAGHEADVFTSNMYLAEDRILTWELVAKPGHSWVLRFVKSAQGETDVPDSIAEFISQRRRWLNGSFFAGTYALSHTMQLLRTEHSFGRKITLMFQALYNLLTLLFTWFGMANYWIFFMVLTSSLEDPNFNLPHIAVANTIVQYLYGGNVVACFMLAMGNRPQGSHWKYLAAIIIFAVTTAYMIGAAAFCVFRAIQDSPGTLIFVQIVISLISTYGSYVIASILALDPWHLVTSMLQYMLFAPVYINLLNIFAFCNLHDFSWGTKEQTSQEIDLGLAKTIGKDTVEISLPSTQIDIDGAYDEALMKLKTRPMIIPRPLNMSEKTAAKMDYYKNVRTNVLLAWVLSNALLGATILQGNYSNTFSAGGGNGRTQIYLLIVLIFVAIMAVIRLVGSTTYLIMRLFAG